jgi:Fanconi anemia group M protein
MKLLEMGAEGATLEQLSSDAELEWANQQIVRAALNQLISEELVSDSSYGKYTVSSALKAPAGKVYEISVEKIYPGSAVVLVNEKWRARLEPHDYNGPQKLIKRNSTFKAIADLYRMNGVLHVRVKDVVQKLE